MNKKEDDTAWRVNDKPKKLQYSEYCIQFFVICYIIFFFVHKIKFFRAVCSYHILKFIGLAWLVKMNMAKIVKIKNSWNQNSFPR